MNIENSRVSIISQADIRYEGKLYKLEKETKSIYLKEVKSFGTEDRRQTNPVPPAPNVYPLILFRGSEIKEISVLGDSPSPEAAAPSQAQQKQAPRRESADYNDKLFDKEDEDEEPASKPSNLNPSEAMNSGAQKSSVSANVSKASPERDQPSKEESGPIRNGEKEPEEEESKAPPGSLSRGAKRAPGVYNNNYGGQQKYYNNRGGYQNNRGGMGYNGSSSNYRGGYGGYGNHMNKSQSEAVLHVNANFDYSKTNEEFEKEKAYNLKKNQDLAPSYNKDDFFDFGLTQDQENNEGPSTNQRALNSETFGARGNGRPNSMRGYGQGNYRGGNNYHQNHNYNNGGGYYQKNRNYGGSNYGQRSGWNKERKNEWGPEDKEAIRYVRKD
jgi:protein LSM14